jgi:hypothetical protein
MFTKSLLQLATRFSDEGHLAVIADYGVDDISRSA